MSVGNERLHIEKRVLSAFGVIVYKIWSTAERYNIPSYNII